MAKTIAESARLQLNELESLIHANSCLARLSVDLAHSSGAMTDYSSVAFYLGGLLTDRFELFHQVISKELIPLVADVKAASVAGG